MGITCSDDNGRKDDEDGDPLGQDGHGQGSPVDRTTDILMMGGTRLSVADYSTLPHAAIDYNIGLETDTSILDRTVSGRQTTFLIIYCGTNCISVTYTSSTSCTCFRLQ